MQASPCSSDRARSWVFVCALALLAGACATVRPEDKEFLAEPSMTWANSTIAARHEAHVIDNREGSTGGGQTQGGGCGCN